MKRSAFAVYRRIHLVVGWYGSEFNFYRKEKNVYGEPTGNSNFVQKLDGIYHATARDFIELVSTEGVSVKAKFNKGILCPKDIKPIIRQGDEVEIQEVNYLVTAIEPVIYSEDVIAYEISIEEVVQGVN